MAGLGLTSIAYMAEKFPEKWMEKIPYYRSKDHESDSRRSKGHSRKHSSSHKSSRKYRRDDDYDDYESDVSDDEYNGRGSRRHHRSSSLDGRRYEEGARSSRRRSYNPADYMAVDRNGYAAYPSAAPRAAAAGSTAPPTAYADPSRPPSASGPTPGYVPYAHVYSGPSRSNYAQAPKPAYYASAGPPDELSPRDSRRSSGDRYARAEPRSARYNDARYESGSRGSRDYESDSDVRYRRRGSKYYEYPFQT